MSGCADQDLEVSALRSIYCKEGEMTDSKDLDHRKILINLDVTRLPDKNVLTQSERCSARVLFSLPHDYPESSCPLVEVKCLHLDKTAMDVITEALFQRAQELQGQMMLLDLACLAKELVENELLGSAKLQRTEFESSCFNQASVSKGGLCSPRFSQAQKSEEGKRVTSQNLASGEVLLSADCTSNFVTTLLHLDHMRSKSSYCKLIKKWVLELGLVGRLIFCQRLIFILLQGNQKAIKEYIVRNRTTNVDVDSKGKSCKERMLSVLCEVATHPEQKMVGFSIEEFGPQELTAFFAEQNLENIYSNHVLRLLLGPSGSSSRTQ